MTQPTVADALLAEFSYWKERFLDPSNDGGYPPDDDHSHALQQAILEAARQEWSEVFIGTRTGDKTRNWSRSWSGTRASRLRTGTSPFQ